MKTVLVRHRIRARRLQLKLTQAQVAARLQTYGVDVSDSWVSALESGKIRLQEERVCAIAAALETDPNGLFGWEEFQKVIRS